MQRETQKYLYDAMMACKAIIEFTAGKSLDDYNSHLLLSSAIERQLTIIGEALNQAVRTDPTLSKMIIDVREIINLRNVIIHAYATVENETIWGIVQKDVPVLHQQIQTLLSQ